MQEIGRRIIFWISIAVPTICFMAFLGIGIYGVYNVIVKYW